MKVAILLNPHASRAREGDPSREILAACREAGLDARLHVCDAAQLTTFARSLASTAHAVIAAGGDGTVSAVAAGLVGSGVPLGVIPLGTRNHFARDIGVTDVATAIAAIARGRTRRIDVAEVNGHTFVNNSSIGLYPEMVSERRQLKWLAVARASLRTLLKFPLMNVAVKLAGDVFSARTPFVMVGNNPYALEPLGSRPRLDGGKLAIYTMRVTRRFSMLRMLARALVRRKRPVEVEEHDVERADIVIGKRSVKVALDGEVRRLRSPLTYRTRPRALVVLGAFT